MAKSETKTETVEKTKYDSVVAERDQLKKDLSDTQGKLSESEKALTAATSSIRGYKANATRAKNVAAELEASTKARTFETIGDPLHSAELEELLQTHEGEFELVFLEGDREIKGLAPRALQGSAFRRTSRGLMLEVADLTVHGPAGDKRPYRITGYALLFGEGGDLVARSTRSDAVTVGAGQSVQLKDDVIF